MDQSLLLDQLYRSIQLRQWIPCRRLIPLANTLNQYCPYVLYCPLRPHFQLHPLVRWVPLVLWLLWLLWSPFGQFRLGFLSRRLNLYFQWDLLLPCYQLHRLCPSCQLSQATLCCQLCLYSRFHLVLLTLANQLHQWIRRVRFYRLVQVSLLVQCCRRDLGRLEIQLFPCCRFGQFGQWLLPNP